MPPVCQPCNRQFRNKEAAMQHLQSSGAKHPSCNHPRCEGRRFLSEQARDAHMEDKHPPTFDCESCDRSFASPSALEDHYRDSRKHPNCVKCGMGFVDGKARDEHHHSTHPRVPCQLCGGLMIYEDFRDIHYLVSAKHPLCGTCNQGFKDAAAYEEISAHPKPQCVSCEREFPDNETLQRHYYVSPSHPGCLLCQVGFKDNVEYEEHLASHPAPSKTRQQLSGSISETSHDLLPLSSNVINTTQREQQLLSSSALSIENFTADFRASSKNDTLDLDIPKLRTTDDYDEVSVSTAERPLGDKVNHLIERLQVLFGDKDEYKRLLRCRKSEAQKLLDMFQRLLDILKAAPPSSPPASFHRNLIVATQRLAGKSCIYPTCFRVAGVGTIGDHSESAGRFADIYKGIFQGRAVCLKTIRLDKKMQVEHFLKVCSKEAILWGQLSHPNLLPFFGMVPFKGRISLVSPWMEHGDINEYLKNHPAANRVLLMLDVAEGLRFLHNNGIIHGDLKGSNILIMESGRACIADFGISSISDRHILAWTSHSSAASKGGSVRWQAPELFNPEGEEEIPNTVASDIYAWSCVVYEMFTGQFPFARLRDATVMVKVRAGERPARPPVSSSSWSAWGLTEHIWTLMEDCWKTSPEERPTIDEIIDYLERIAPEDPRMIQGDSALSSAQFRELAREGLEHVDLSVETLESLL